MKAFVVRQAHVCFDVEVEGVRGAATARGAPGRLVTHDRVLTAEGGASGALHRNLVATTIAGVWMEQKIAKSSEMDKYPDKRFSR